MRANAYPEGVNYPDTGCEVAPACLSCPLAECVYVGATRRLPEKARLRNLRIVEAGGPAREVAETVGVSVNTVYRARARSG